MSSSRSGREAGYEFARNRNCIQDDVDNYAGNSESFRNGMQDFVNEQEAKNKKKQQ